MADQVLESLTPPKLSPLSVTMHWMGDGDNAQVFLEAFRAMTEACQWSQRSGPSGRFTTVGGGSNGSPQPTANLVEQLLNKEAS